MIIILNIPMDNMTFSTDSLIFISVVTTMFQHCKDNNKLSIIETILAYSDTNANIPLANGKRPIGFGEPLVVGGRY